MYLRSAERAQAEIVRNYFSMQEKGTKASEVLKSLFEQGGDQKEAAATDSLTAPRFQLTLSHQLMLPGEWERVQYLAVHLILHSRDVVFADTNEFESILRDIDLGKLVQTAANKATAESSMGFGDTTVASSTVNRPGSAKAGLEFSYTEQLDRALKEQLQFRASAIDTTQQVFSIVLKSSQTNKLPTLARQTITLRYKNVVSADAGYLATSFKNGSFASLKLVDFPYRDTTSGRTAAIDANVAGHFLVHATPLYVAVVRRVRNAKGVNTSLEDDDHVEYVTQAGLLPPIRLHQTSKCASYIAGLTTSKEEAYVVVAPAAGSPPTVAIVEGDAQTQQFIAALRSRFDAAAVASKTNGLAFGESDVRH
ncbi:MAG: hypothetical protein QM813_00590 [Verrucomicrobiota bacterium]